MKSSAARIGLLMLSGALLLGVARSGEAGAKFAVGPAAKSEKAGVRVEFAVDA